MKNLATLLFALVALVASLHAQAQTTVEKGKTVSIEIPVEADVRERADAEAAESKRLAPFREKAEKFKNTSKTNWELTDTKDEMSGSKIVFANAQVRLGLSTVESKLRCEGGSLKISFTVFNGTYLISNSLDGSTVDSALACMLGGAQGVINGRLKANDDLIGLAYCMSPDYRNVVDTTVFVKKKFEDGSFQDYWGLMFEIPTNNGKALFYLPTADQAVSKVIDTCK